MKLSVETVRTMHTMEKHYINEAHRRYSEACQRAVREMMEHPLSWKKKEAQMLRNKALSKSEQASSGHHPEW